MPIHSDADLEKAVSEFQTLQDAPDDSAQAERRRELDAAIKDYYARHGNDLRPGKPPSAPHGG
ncbi:hypothetical protein M2352_002135 [Azospirillum fermentarium]|uniref:hypothetical protein n=1 Tax=Azospirillum fermentarium TaxID=1233114 RepID=UPI002227F9B9|nr:hypothetical protein [Azospirillum fermentarium]MCW2246544.1 hypothetical protein [Azospirillum fermentarium]